MEYINEWTEVGQLGRALVAIALGSSFVATIAFAKRWERLGRWAFWTHAVALLGTIGIIFLLFATHRYEFQYIWKHLNNLMPMRFILSAFWGGQEGGFLLWMFWNMVLAAVVLLGKESRWKMPVMAWLSGIMLFLSSMLLGVYFGDFLLGLDPFLLLRDAPENLGLPWTRQPDYLSAFPLFQDGKGLNPLLQNYWMTIHPPTLFLGFAATTVPFAYAMAGLFDREDRSWMRPALRWSFFGVGILGTGILMGGAWAYEALSFGGFWAWDPVENASLVPWLTLVAGAHLLLINRNRKEPTALFSTYYLPIITYLLVVYSTFLTKSGILGDTSVHSFVDSGILPQLLAFLLTYTALAHAALLPNRQGFFALLGLWGLMFWVMWKGYPAEGVLVGLAGSGVAAAWAFRKGFEKRDEEESLASREFWMFAGAMLLVVSALHITFQTSIPVINHFLAPFAGLFERWGEAWDSDFLRRLAAHDFAPGTDLDATYHRIQVPLAVLISVLMGSTQWLSYRGAGNQKPLVLKRLRLSLLATLVVGLVLLGVYGVSRMSVPLTLLLLSTAFAVFANLQYIWAFLRGKWDAMGASVAHVGFGLLLFGAVLSTSQKDIISQNQIGDIRSLSEELDNREDLLMMQGDTLSMGPYFVHYARKYTEGIHVKFDMEYFERADRLYRTGDVVYFDGMVFEALEDHVASANFEDDIESRWRFLPMPNKRQAEVVAPWESGIPGPKLFTLSPRIQLNEQMGNAPEPDTRHGLFQDLYTHIKWGRVTPLETDEEGWLGGRKQSLVVGDSMLIGGTLLTLDSLRSVPVEERPDRGLLDKDLALAACITLSGKSGKAVHQPLYIVRDSLLIPDLYEATDWGLKFRVDQFSPETETLEMTIWEHASVKKDFVVMQAAIFPLINVLWVGCILMALGTFMAVRSRWKRDARVRH